MFRLVNMVDLLEVSYLGSFQYSDGSKYHGQWNLWGMRHGAGQLTLPSGDVYLGYWQQDQFSGLGYLRFADNSYYLGQFMSGWFHGQGCYVTSQQTKYEGYFRSGRVFGLGRVTFSPGIGGHLDGLYKEWRFVQPASVDSIVSNVQRMCAYFFNHVDQTTLSPSSSILSSEKSTEVRLMISKKQKMVRRFLNTFKITSSLDHDLKINKQVTDDSLSQDKSLKDSPIRCVKNFGDGLTSATVRSNLQEHCLS